MIFSTTFYRVIDSARLGDNKINIYFDKHIEIPACDICVEIEMADYAYAHYTLVYWRGQFWRPTGDWGKSSMILDKPIEPDPWYYEAVDMISTRFPNESEMANPL